MMHPLFGQRALLDIRSIQLHYLLCASQNVAQRHLEVIFKGIDLLCELPELGRLVDDDSLVIAPGYRRYLSGDFWIYYTCAGDNLTIIRIFHSKQDIDDFAFQELE